MKKGIIFIIFAFLMLLQNTAFAEAQNINESYINRIQKKIESNWVPASGLYDKGTTLLFTMDENGHILNVKVISPSGNNNFDKSAIMAVYKSDPLEHLPGNFKSVNQKFKFVFNPGNSELSLLDDSIVKTPVVNYIKENIVKKEEQKSITKETPIKKANVLNNAEQKENVENVTNSVSNNTVDFKPYLKKLQNKIKSNWEPGYRYKQNEKVIILFKINKDGSLAKHIIFKTSGEEIFDQKATDAILKTAPFEPLPAEYIGESIDVQFTFAYNVFRLNEDVNEYNVNYISNINDSSDKPIDLDKCQSYKNRIYSIISYNLPQITYFREKHLILRIVIDKNGKLKSVETQQSSGDKRFDKKIINIVKKLSFPPIPDNLNTDTFSFNYVVNVEKIDFSLDDEGWQSNFFMGSILNLISSILLLCVLH
ncbi:MAG: TonB family protein [Candidatus Gastranaerophilales bacterium]|nr:TonB family protein [Candidatus Gastranaerophilales bacterium]